jgi:hypothetical protein
MDKEKIVKRITVETNWSKKGWWTEVKMGGCHQRGSGKNEDSELD